MKQKLLFINNYLCTLEQNDSCPKNHFWGVEELLEYYDVTCAKVPGDLIHFSFKGVYFINTLYKCLYLAIRYFSFPIVYSACGELTAGFALFNMLHLGKRKLFKIHHHGGKSIFCSKGYTKILFISSCIRKYYANLSNTSNIVWGGDIVFAQRCLQTAPIKDIRYDFISAGKAGRDHRSMILAANQLDTHTMIISAINDTDYDKDKVTVLSGTDSKKNSTGYVDVFHYYIQSKFIVIPIVPRNQGERYVLSGLTTFVDAVVLHKPVLISDNTNMGVDVEGLGIGMVYKAGDVEDMRKKMQLLLSLPDGEYQKMCDNMKRYSVGRSYADFCSCLLKQIRES